MSFVTVVRKTSRAVVTLSGTDSERVGDDLRAVSSLHSTLNQTLAALMPALEVLLDGLEEQGALKNPAAADFKAGAQEFESGHMTLRVSRQPQLTEAELGMARARLSEWLIIQSNAPEQPPPAGKPWWKFWG